MRATSAGADGPRRGRRTAFVVGLAAWGLLAATWALASPLMSVPDEPAHVLRAASLVQGELLGEVEAYADDGPPPVRATFHRVPVPAGFEEVAGLHMCFAPYRDTADCAAPLREEPGTVRVTTTAGAYPPPFYAVVGVPTALLPPAAAVLAGRLLHAAAVALLLAAATAAAWDVGGRWLVVGVIVAVTPAVPYLAGGINPSGIEIASALALWVGGLELVVRPGPRPARLVAAAGAVLAWSRPLSPAIVLGILACTGVLALDGPRWQALRRDRSARWAAATVGVAVLTAAAWIAWSDALGSFIAYPDPALTWRDALVRSWRMSWYRLQQLVGVLGWLDTPLRPWTVNLWGLVAVGLGVGALVLGTWRQRLVLLALVAATVGAPLAVEVLTAAEQGFVWQGRYTLPVTVGYGVVGGWALAHGLRRVDDARATAVAVAVAGVCAVGHVAAHLTSMSRYSTGYGTSLVAYLRAPGWQGALPDAALLVLVLLGAAGVVALAALPEAPATAVDSP